MANGLPVSSSFQAGARLLGQALMRAAQSNSPRPMAVYNQKFINLAAAAGRQAAQQATKTSRNTFQSRLSGRPVIAPRRGRPTTQGTFSQFINWDFVSRDDDIVFDLPYLDTAAPYWAIQEIGTNHSARIIDSAAGPGSVSVRSQRGRRISANLVWASGPGRQASAAGRGIGNEQLFLRAQVLANNVRRRRIRINKEIKAKHYLRDGAKSGFGTYRQELSKAFRQAYK